MKKKILFVLSTCLVLLAVSSKAQISVEPEIAQAAFLSADLTDNFLDLSEEIVVTNISSETIDIVWTRTVPADCPQDWDTQICDNNFCYTFPVSTNINPGGTPNTPFTLEPGESFDEFAMHFWPRMTSGCCAPTIDFALVDDPENILATVTFEVSINDNSCGFVSSTDEENKLSTISIYPNPTLDRFTITDNQLVKKLTVYNILGRAVRAFNYQDGEYFDISDLADGLYLVGLQNKDGQVLKTLRVSKRGLRP